jgi:hypothetical protein
MRPSVAVGSVIPPASVSVTLATGADSKPGAGRRSTARNGWAACLCSSPARSGRRLRLSAGDPGGQQQPRPHQGLRSEGRRVRRPSQGDAEGHGHPDRRTVISEEVDTQLEKATVKYLGRANKIVGSLTAPAGNCVGRAAALPTWRAGPGCAQYAGCHLTRFSRRGGVILT